MSDLPCKKCPVLAICRNKERIKCAMLYDYEADHKFVVFPIEELPKLRTLENRNEGVDFRPLGDERTTHKYKFMSLRFKRAEDVGDIQSLVEVELKE